METDKIIKTNSIFGGTIKSRNALDYAVEQANMQKNVFRQLALVVRSMTSEHAFWDGNKRTSLTIILSELQNLGVMCNKQKLESTLIKLSASGEGDLEIIERRLRKCIKK